MKISTLKTLRTTVFVAASDAPDRTKLAADLVCDGINDAQIVLEAEAMLGHDGGVIVLSEGTFHGRFAITKPYVTLQGQGRFATTLRLPDNTNVEAQTLTIVADYVTVRDLGVDGNKDNQVIDRGGGDMWQYADGIAGYGDYNTIERCFVTNTMAHGIIFWQRETTSASNAQRENVGQVRRHNTIRGCLVTNHGDVRAYGPSHGIDSAYYTEFFRVIDNVIIGGGDPLNSAGIAAHSGSHDVYMGNTVINCLTGIQVTGAWRYSPRPDGVTEVLVTNNTLINCGMAEKASILVRRVVANTVIANNVIVGSVTNGIEVNESHNVVVNANSIRNSTGHGIAIVPGTQEQSRKVVVTDNSILGSGGWGLVSVEGSDLLVTSNLFDNGLNGIYLQGDDDGVRHGCGVVKDNIIRFDHSNGDRFGIKAEHADGLIVGDNIIQNAGTPTSYTDVEHSMLNANLELSL